MSLTSYQELAVAFASALVEGDFARAWKMLGPALSESMSVADLNESFDRMYRSYADGDRPKRIWFDPEHSGEDWPAKQNGDVGWAYVAVQVDEVSEAVTVTVAQIAGRLLIREIEWGRP